MKRNSQQGFTLTEVMVATVITVLMMGGVLSFLMQTMWAWRDGMAWIHLLQQQRMVRERILRSIDYKYGLLEASLASVTLYPGSATHVDWINFDVDPNLWPTPQANDDISCRVHTNPGLELNVRTVPGSGQPIPLCKPEIKTDLLHLDRSGRVVNAQIVLSYTTGGKKFTHQQNIRTYLVND